MVALPPKQTPDTPSDSYCSTADAAKALAQADALLALLKLLSAKPEPLKMIVLRTADLCYRAFQPDEFRATFGVTGAAFPPYVEIPLRVPLPEYKPTASFEPVLIRTRVYVRGRIERGILVYDEQVR